VESEGGKLSDVCDEFFEIEYPHSLGPTKFTYQPAIARQRKIDLIATGSPALEEIVQQCLNKGVLASISLKTKVDPEAYLENFFKDSAYSCDYCETMMLEDKEVSFCTKSPRCYHKINNGKIGSIRIIRKQPLGLLQFYFSAFFKNKLRKNEETIRILLDEDGNNYDSDILTQDQFEFNDSEEKIDIESYDKLKPIVDEKLDSILKDKKTVFDLLLEKQVKGRLRNLERQLEEEKLERSISKKGANFDEDRWKIEKDTTLTREQESFKTTIDLKFLNLLSIRTEKVSFEITLHNNSKIESSFIVGIDNPAKIICFGCGKTFYEGYATEDGYYLCIDCIKQTVDTGKTYSKNYDLPVDATTNEYIEEKESFLCSVCGKLNSKLFEFKCNYDGSSVCVNCSTLCAKCGKLFSVSNAARSKESGRMYCSEHIIKCDNCGSPIGIDEYRTCCALGKRVCSCTKFAKCTICEQQYSIESLVDGKCPACNHLMETSGSDIISPIVRHNPSRGKTKKWLVGKNRLNSVAIAKGFFSDILFVVEGDTVVHQKTIRLFDKLRGH
jgi:hypothetical protein